MEHPAVGRLLFDASLCVKHIVLSPNAGSPLPDVEGASVRDVEQKLGLQMLSADAEWVLAEQGTVERTVSDNGPVRSVRVMPREEDQGVEAVLVGAPATDAPLVAPPDVPAAPQRPIDAYRNALAEALRVPYGPMALQEAAAQVLKEQLGIDRVHYGTLDAAEDRTGIHAACTSEAVSSLATPYVSALRDAGLQRDGHPAEAIVVEDTGAESPPTKAEPAQQSAHGIAAWVGVPLGIDGESPSFLAVAAATPRTWTDAAVTLVKETAPQLRTAVRWARAQRSLRQSRARLQALTAATSGEVYRMSPDGSAGDFLTTKDLGLGIEPLRKAWRAEHIPEALAPALADGQVLESKHTVEAATNTRRRVHLRTVPVRDDEGAIVEWLGTARDVTEHEQVEAAPQRSDDRLEAFLAQLPVGAGMTNAEGEWVFKTSVLERYVEEASPSAMSVGESRWRCWTDDGTPVPPEEWPVARALRGETVQPGMDFLCSDVKGETRWIRVRAMPCHGPNGDVVGAVVVMQDIHERGPSQQGLRDLNDILEAQAARGARKLTQSEQEFEALVNASAAMVWRTDAQGEVTEDSPSWRAYTGQSVEDLEEGRWLEAVHPDDQDTTMALWNQSVAQEVLMLNEFRLYHAESNTYRWVRVRAVPLRREDGSVRSWLGMNIDIHDRKRVEEKLRALTHELEARVGERTQQVQDLSSRLTMAEQRERQRLAEVLHDDLQQRLYGINLQLSTLRKQVERGDWAALLEHIDTAEAWLKDAIRTTRQLSVDLSPPVLSTEGLPEALAWLRTQMHELYDLDVQVRTDLQDAPGLAEDMRVLLFQSVRELLFNVVKHAGVLRATVRVADEDTGLSIVVSDDGQGFDPDAELDSSAGFGLTSVRKRIELFGGDVSVSSAPGAGTAVHIRVPSELLQQSRDRSANTA